MDTIVYIEDDEQAREGFSESFSNDANVITFASADSALEGLKKLVSSGGSDHLKSSPQVIVSDQKLGKEDLGWKVLNESLAICPSSYRFILSGYSEPEMIYKSFQKGVILDYISKESPVDSWREKILGACKLWHLMNDSQVASGEKGGALNGEFAQIESQLEGLNKLADKGEILQESVRLLKSMKSAADQRDKDFHERYCQMQTVVKNLLEQVDGAHTRFSDHIHRMEYLISEYEKIGKSET